MDTSIVIETPKGPSLNSQIYPPSLASNVSSSHYLQRSDYTSPFVRTELLSRDNSPEPIHKDMLNRIELIEGFIKQKKELLNSIKKPEFSTPSKKDPSTERKTVSFLEDDFKRTYRDRSLPSFRSNNDTDKENRLNITPPFRSGIEEIKHAHERSEPSNIIDTQDLNMMNNWKLDSNQFDRYKGAPDSQDGMNRNELNGMNRNELSVLRNKYIDMNEKYQEKCRECASLYARLKEEAILKETTDSESIRRLIQKNQTLEQELIESKRKLAQEQSQSKLFSKRETAWSLRDTVEEKVSRLLKISKDALEDKAYNKLYEEIESLKQTFLNPEQGLYMSPLSQREGDTSLASSSLRVLLSEKEHQLRQMRSDFDRNIRIIIDEDILPLVRSLEEAKNGLEAQIQNNRLSASGNQCCNCKCLHCDLAQAPNRVDLEQSLALAADLQRRICDLQTNQNMVFTRIIPEPVIYQDVIYTAPANEPIASSFSSSQGNYKTIITPPRVTTLNPMVPMVINMSPTLTASSTIHLENDFGKSELLVIYLNRINELENNLNSLLVLNDRLIALINNVSKGNDHREDKYKEGGNEGLGKYFEILLKTQSELLLKERERREEVSKQTEDPRLNTLEIQISLLQRDIEEYKRIIRSKDSEIQTFKENYERNPYRSALDQSYIPKSESLASPNVDQGFPNENIKRAQAGPSSLPEYLKKDKETTISNEDRREFNRYLFGAELDRLHIEKERLEIELSKKRNQIDSRSSQTEEELPERRAAREKSFPSQEGENRYMLIERQEKLSEPASQQENITLRQAIERLRAENDRILSDYSKLLAAFERKNRELELTIEQKEQMKNDISDLKSERDRLGKQRDQIKLELEEIKPDRNQLREENVRLASEIERLKHEIENSQRNEKEIRSQESRRLQTMRTEFERKITALENKITDLNFEIDSLNQETASKGKECDDLKKQLNRMKADAKALTAEISQKEHELEEAEQSLTLLKSEIKSKSKEIEKLRSELSELRHELSQAEAEISKLRCSLETSEKNCRTLKGQLESLEKTHEENLEELKNKCHKEYSALLEKYRNLERTSASELNSLRDQIASLEEENTSLKRQLSSNKFARNELKKKNVEDEDEIIKVERSAQTPNYYSDYEELKTEREESRKKFEFLQGENENLKRELNQVTSQLIAHKSELEKFLSERDPKKNFRTIGIETEATEGFKSKEIMTEGLIHKEDEKFLDFERSLRLMEMEKIRQEGYISKLEGENENIYRRLLENQSRSSPACQDCIVVGELNAILQRRAIFYENTLLRFNELLRENDMLRKMQDQSLINDSSLSNDGAPYNINNFSSIRIEEEYDIDNRIKIMTDVHEREINRLRNINEGLLSTLNQRPNQIFRTIRLSTDLQNDPRNDDIMFSSFPGEKRSMASQTDNWEYDDIKEENLKLSHTLEEYLKEVDGIAEENKRRLEGLKSEKSRIESECIFWREKYERISTFETIIHEMEDKFNNLQKENEDLRTNLQKRKSIDKEKQALEIKVKKLLRENDELKRLTLAMEEASEKKKLDLEGIERELFTSFKKIEHLSEEEIKNLKDDIIMLLKLKDLVKMERRKEVWAKK